MKTALSILLFAALAFAARASDVRKQMINLINSSDCTEVLATGSMKPAFDENYWLLTLNIPFDQLKVGMVIIYMRTFPIVVDGKNYFRICHRIIAMSNPEHKAMIVQGDACMEPDHGLVTEDNYVCVVVGTIRKDAVARFGDGQSSEFVLK